MCPLQRRFRYPRARYIGILFIRFTVAFAGLNKIVRYTGDMFLKGFVICQGSIIRFIPAIYIRISVLLNNIHDLVSTSVG